MFTLVLHTEKEKKTFSFEQSTVVVGFGSLDKVDLLVPDQSLQEKHLLLLWEEGTCFVVNRAQDLLARLNGDPFGKKPIQEGDLLQLGSCTVEVQKLTPPKEGRTRFLSEEAEERIQESTPIALLTHVKPSEEQVISGPFSSKAPSSWSVQRICVLFFAAAILFSFLLIGLYSRATDRSSQEEKKIAAGIADIAMALMHANIYEITPDHQNWLDTTFLDTNFHQVTSSSVHSQANIDGEGKFTRFPYRLRVYMEPKRKRFVVIAQPDPYLFQSLIPKKALIIDSDQMVIRKMQNVASLNRLFSVHAPLTGQNGVEIREIIQQSALMPLDALSGRKNLWGFSPPPSLAAIRPGAENYIYNAPRYHSIGGRILKQAVELYSSSHMPEKLSRFQDELNQLNQFPDLVFYSTEETQKIETAAQALRIFAPRQNFLVASLSFSQQGVILGASLLPDVPRPEQPNHTNELALEDTFHGAATFAEYERHDPLLLQLKLIKTARNQALKLIGDELIALIQEQNVKMQPGFHSRFRELTKNYHQMNRFYQEKLVHDLARLKEQYSDRPWEEFLECVEASGLHRPFTWIIRHEDIDQFRRTKGEIIRLIDQVQNTKTLPALDHLVSQVLPLLTIDSLSSPELISRYQKHLNRAVKSQLKLFFLSPNSPLLSHKGAKTSKELVRNLLKSVWVTDPYELAYFLEEYDEFLVGI